MRTVWTVPPNIAQTLLESPEIQMFLTSNELPETADDPRQRLTEFTHALGALSRNIGRTFGSVDAANRDLFGGSAGTVPVALRLTVLRAIVTEVDDRTPTPDPLPATVVDQLGAYVYALLDPRDRTVVHIGSGRGNRIFALTWTALGEAHKLTAAGESAPPATPEAEAALRRVRAVYESGYSVEHFVVADHLLPAADGDHAAGATAQAVIAALGLLESHRGEFVLTNLAGTTGDAEADRVARPIAELVRQYSAKAAPELPTPCVVLRITDAKSASAEQVRDLADRPWPAGSAARRVDGLPILVVADNIVRGAYRATGWEAASRTEENGGTILYRFLGESDPELEKLFVDTRVTPDRLGLKRWPSHGWAPRLTRAMPRATPRPRT
ncbi:GIY-YIG nuclease family protein [Rhodococcus zopfii]|uniref:GIY-YIG nuclease family protein n=1 Tax=Rhodococcus zopfii TaxID=43772 RepID=A0ABU3WV60_9NOCA|nr:GIY-YIG nuclease family protein [Rhodococcus zopfii]MDV2477622.1 GIY-YIG nuclease family protein [Rhodococcus zopfii]